MLMGYGPAYKIPERIGRIDEIAHNLWWCWHPEARDLFRSLDYPLWKASGHNPVKILFDTAPAKLQAAAEDPEFLGLYDRVIAEYDRETKNQETWFNIKWPELNSGPIAYFSMEFALHNSLPIYAGGLGVLAGDFCKEASDCGVPLVGVGFMYPQGYFQQRIGADGWQREIYRQLNFVEAPINRLYSSEGRRAIVEVAVANRMISLGVWQVKVGRVNLYLLDTDIEENQQIDRKLTARLYNADQETRIQQEILLGIGGVRVLRSLGVNPSIWHANEGHSAFMSMERIREYVQEGISFEDALAHVRESTVFTTHTPVAGGHDVFSPALIDKYFSSYLPLLGVERERFLELGTPDIRDRSGFNMTALSIKTAEKCNAVSRVHEQETKKMWNELWPDTAEEDIPVTHVTNGIHVPSWIGLEFTQLFETYMGADWLTRQDEQSLWDGVQNIPDDEIWNIHRSLKRRLIEIIVTRAQKRWIDGDTQPQQIITMGVLFDPDVLTIGFSRRFAEYKRAALILQDIPRLSKIVNNPWHPVQIVFSGKAHPNDSAGKAVLQQVYNAAAERAFHGRIAFVEDYDMHIARYLVHGVDVWLNNPWRPLEASGTSGMKAGVNGIPNLSVRDGWWEEGYNGSNGWAIGKGPEGSAERNQNTEDAESLYNLIENHIVPAYYQRDRKGVPHQWVGMAKESIRSVIPHFCTRRMMREYIEKLYLPLLKRRQGERAVSG
jgi:glycogen phosphorylase